MRLTKAIAIPVFILTLTYSCILPYELEVSPYDRVIVVDGVITTEMDKHTVNLSYTYRIDSYEPLALSGAQVWVEDDIGEIYDFTEMDAGEYKSNLQFAASINRGYQLFFTTDNGRQYHSNKIKPVPSPPIKRVYDQYAEIIPENSTNKVGGIQFFLDSYDSTGNAKHFRYEWEETYKKGLLSFWMLLSLTERPMYAYEMKEAVAAFSQGSVSADEKSRKRRGQDRVEACHRR